MSGFKGLFFKAMLAMAVFSVAFGCGGSKVEPQVAVVPAKGRVTIKGQPGANLALAFIPAGQGSNLRPQANTGADGTFEITTYKTGDGGPEGEYKVVVSVAVDPTLSDSKKEELAGKLAAEAKRIPAAYQRGDTTPLTVKIEKGKADLGVLEIK